MNVVNDFLDILQNIEAAIIATYKAHPEISDKDVLLATERLIGSYTRERKKLPALPVSLPKNSMLMYEAMKGACEFRLTRESLNAVDDEVVGYRIPVRLLIPCLDRLEKSMQMWHKRDGFRGYLAFIGGQFG